MKLVKLLIAFSILIIVVLGVLTITKVVTQDWAIDIGWKSLSALVICFGGLIIVNNVFGAGNKPTPKNDTPNSGPKF